MPKGYPKRASSSLTKKLQNILPTNVDKLQQNSRQTIALDSNIYVSCLIGSDIASQTVQLAFQTFNVAISQQIIDEICEFIDDSWRKARSLKQVVRVILPEKCAFFIDVDAYDLPNNHQLRDQKDQHVLKLAKISCTKIIVTGDKDLLELEVDQHIVSLKSFLEIFN